MHIYILSYWFFATQSASIERVGINKKSDRIKRHMIRNIIITITKKKNAAIYYIVRRKYP